MIQLFAYGNDSNKVRLRESDVQASTRKWQLTRPLAFLWSPFSPMIIINIVWEDKICYTFIIFIRHRTADNNQRHLSHGFKNIIFRDRGPNMHYL